MTQDRPRSARHNSNAGAVFHRTAGARSDGPPRTSPHFTGNSDLQPTPSGSQSELLELRRGFSNLSRQHKSATYKVDTLREERLALRTKLSTNEKQLSLMKRRVAALASERDLLKRERSTDHARLHKMEAKVNAMQDSALLHDKFTSLKKKQKAVREENAALKAKLESVAEDQATQSHEISTLQTALRLKTQEIVEETGKDIPTRLLYVTLACPFLLSSPSFSLASHPFPHSLRES